MGSQDTKVNCPLRSQGVGDQMLACIICGRFDELIERIPAVAMSAEPCHTLMIEAYLRVDFALWECTASRLSKDLLHIGKFCLLESLWIEDNETRTLLDSVAGSCINASVRARVHRTEHLKAVRLFQPQNALNGKEFLRFVRGTQPHCKP